MPINLSRVAAKPFLKWAGGKTQLLSDIQKILLEQFPKNSSFTYIEPFVGGGAVLFSILEIFDNLDRVIINDINNNLVIAYRTIKLDPIPLIEKLREIEQYYYSLDSLKDKKELFLIQRNKFNLNKVSQLEKTALLLFLNKTCFNGLYRVNSKGLFNVPFGSYLKPKICDESNLINVHRSLQKVEIFQGDFQQVLSYANENTLFYLDPPYKPIRITSAFTSYSKENFDDEDQVRLKKFCDEVHRRGGKFILSNSDVKNYDIENDFFDSLYEKYQIKRVKAKRNINSIAEGRGEVTELLITNF